MLTSAPLLLLTALLSQALLPSAPTARADISAPKVRQIIIQGNSRTREAVIRREIDTKVGESFAPALWAQDVQAVKDLNLFWTTKATAETHGDSIDLYLTVEEKWTLIPSFGFATTPDVLEWYAGLYEANLLGFNMEAGAMFYRKRGGNSYRIWYRNSRLGASDNYLELQASRSRNLRVVYDQQANDDLILGGFEAQTDAFTAELGRRLDLRGYTKLAVLYRPISSRYELWNPPQTKGTEAGEPNELSRPPFRFVQQLGLRFQWGRLNQDDYLFFGRRLDTSVLTIPGFLASSRRYSLMSVDWRHLFRPWGRHNWGYRFFAGRTTSRQISDAYTLGGLYEVRGFRDERFYGQNIWYANLEYRVPILDKRWLLWQVVPFTDLGNTWNGDFLSNQAFHRMALTVGGGVRFVVKPLISTKLRLDYGLALLPYRTSNLNLGIEQFF